MCAIRTPPPFTTNRRRRGSASRELFTGFTPYTYAAYLIHWPIYKWGVFLRLNRVQSFGEFFAIDFGASRCEWGDEAEEAGDAPPLCYQEWPAYITAFSVTIVAAFLLTILVHRPFTKWWNRVTRGAPPRREQRSRRRRGPLREHSPSAGWTLVLFTPDRPHVYTEVFASPPGTAEQRGHERATGVAETPRAPPLSSSPRASRTGQRCASLPPGWWSVGVGYLEM